MKVANDTMTATCHEFTPGFTALFEVLGIDMVVSFYLRRGHRRQWPPGITLVTSYRRYRLEIGYAKLIKFRS